MKTIKPPRPPRPSGQRHRRRGPPRREVSGTRPAAPLAATPPPAWRPPAAVVLGALTAALLVCLLLGTAYGAVSLPLAAVPRMMADQLGLIQGEATWTPAEEIILIEIRLPRVVAGAIVGAALATAGVIYQGLLRNPLADPYVIGASAGAALAATIALALLTGISLAGLSIIPLAAAAGALLAVLMVYRLARVGSSVPTVSLLLAGFATSALLNAGSSLLIVLDDHLQQRLRQLFVWLLGGVTTVGWSPLLLTGALLLVGLLLGLHLAGTLNALALGEEGAAYVGVPVERQKLVLIATGALLTGLAVSLAGLVGFVGLVVPHAVRLAVGPDARLLLVAAALLGVSFLILADLLARTLLAPAELPVGILTALLGAPFFLYLLRRTARGYTF